MSRPIPLVLQIPPTPPIPLGLLRIPKRLKLLTPLRPVPLSQLGRRSRGRPRAPPAVSASMPTLPSRMLSMYLLPVIAPSFRSLMSQRDCSSARPSKTFVSSIRIRNPRTSTPRSPRQSEDTVERHARAVRRRMPRRTVVRRRMQQRATHRQGADRRGTHRRRADPKGADPSCRRFPNFE